MISMFLSMSINRPIHFGPHPYSPQSLCTAKNTTRLAENAMMKENSLDREDPK